MILGISTSSSDIAGNIIHDQTINNCEDIYIREQLIEFIKNYNNQEYPLISSYIIKHEIFGRKPLWWFAKNNININVPNKTINILDYKIHNITTILTSELYNNAIQRLETITNNKTIDELNINNYIEVYKNKLNNISNTDTDTDIKIKISMELSVTTGFYIRQFCNDFGNSINIPAIAFDITRTNIF